MKLIKIIFVLFFAFSLCKAQTTLDPPSILGNLNQNMINQNADCIVRGWNWGNPGKRLDDALSINFYHGDYNKDFYSFSTPNINYISQVGGFSGGHMHYCKLNSMAILFDPAITVDTTRDYEPPSWDATGAIYGFIDKNYGSVDINPSSNTFHRYLLDKTNVSQDELVLSNSWPQEKAFFLLDYSNVNVPSYLLTNLDQDYLIVNDNPVLTNFFPLNGTRWYLSVNLKSLESISTPVNEETVLKIKLKYTMNDDTDGYIIFDKIPKQGNSSITNIVSTLGNNRGKSRQDSVLTSPIDYFPITTKMLRTNTSGTNHTDITLSSHFYARAKVGNDDPLLPFLNPYFEPEAYYDKSHNTSYDNYIKKLEVEVWYCGKLNCAIDWVKIETEQAKDLLTGQLDAALVTSCATLLSNTENTTLNNKINRFYGVDEFLRPHFSAMRYFNKILGGLAQSEFFYDVLPSFKMIDHSLDFREYWDGLAIHWKNETANPYYHWGVAKNVPNMGHLKTLGTTFGVRGVKQFWNNLLQEEVRFDSLNSGYETFLFGGTSAYRRWDGGYYAWSNQQNLLPTQSSWTENQLYNFYYDNYDDNPTTYQETFGSLFGVEKQLFHWYYFKDLLFTGKPWYNNIWSVSENWRYYVDPIDTNQSILYIEGNSSRPQTDAEFRLSASFPLILGAKGLFYWQKTTWNWYQEEDLAKNMPKDVPKFMGMQSFNTIDNSENIPSDIIGLNYILRNEIGGDYMIPFANPIIDPNFTHHYKPNGQYDFASLGIDQYHVFVGSRSLRYEAYKINKFITDNENLLKNLSLVCWYAKGHRKWYVQSPTETQDTVIKEYIDISNLKTRKLFQPNYPGGGFAPLSFEPFEDRFFDLTILQLNGTPITTQFYLGIQNRRTDKSMWVGSLQTPWRLEMKPSAEFDDLCDGPDAPYWRGMYPYELGNRELRGVL
jgi:hypothetical protein